MNSEQIKFPCPSCHTVLQVPANLAGVSGPCPHCGTSITAPRPQLENPSHYPAIPSQPAQIPHAPPPANPPTHSPPESHPPAPHQESAQKTPQLWQQQSSELQPSRPRNLPQTHMDRRRAPDARNARQQNSHARSKPRRWPWTILLLLTFLALLAAITIYILHLLQVIPAHLYPASLQAVAKEQVESRDPIPIPSNNDALQNVAPTEETNETPPDADANLDHSEMPAEEAGAPATTDPEADESQALPIEPQDLKQEGAIPNDPIVQKNNETETRQVQKIALCEEVLTKFLRAQSLASRQPYLQLVSRKKEDLLDTSLNSPLPKAISIRPFVLIDNLADGVESLFFVVALESTENPNYPQLILMETMVWGGQGVPKVNADAFIDIYEKTPLTLLEKKSEKPQDFYCIISPSSFCFDDIPGAQEKATVSFLSYLNKKSHFAKAYLPNDSDLFKQISKRIGIGEDGLANLKIKLNTTEDPERPYLEVIEVNSFTWH